MPVTRQQIKAVETRFRKHAALMGIGRRGVGRLAQCDPYTDYCDDGGWNYWSGGSSTPVTVDSDNGSSSFWDNLFKAITLGGQVAVNVIRADQGGYYTPQGQYAYGTGPYRSMTPTQAQMYLQQYPGGINTGGNITMNWSTIAMLGMGALVLVMMMRR